MSCGRNSRTAELQAPNASSRLLESESSGHGYGGSRQRVVTPVEEIIRQPWYDTLQSAFHEQCVNIQDLNAGPWHAFLGGRLEAILRCLCFPCLVVTRAFVNSGRRSHFKQQPGIMYLYLFLSATVVINLIVALKNIHYPVAEDIQKYFTIISMALAIALMLCLFLFTNETVKFRRSRGTLLRVFYQGGTYLFGFASFGFSVCVAIDYVACGHVLDAVITFMKALFTLLQTLFLLYFYQARFPEDTFCINIALAHLLGTNLGLWFWTLCSEEADETLKNCTDYPIDLSGGEKYFSPIFVEYLLLSANLFYQMWENSTCSEARRTLPERHCSTCFCHVSCRVVENSQMGTENTNDRSNRNTTPRSNNTPDKSDFGLGLFVGAVFATLFVVLVFMSFDSGANDQDIHTAYSGGTIIFYLTQVCACYVIHLSLQSHQRNPERKSIDHEDILLYVSLVGVVLWESFHAYTLVLDGLNSGSEVVDVAGDMVAIVQQLFQTTTLIKSRLHQRTAGQSSAWICQCILFLLVTNLTLWVQDSFCIEVAITTPGERYMKMQHDLTPIGYIVHPLSIFFRFHSAICCIIAWSKFRAGA